MHAVTGMRLFDTMSAELVDFRPGDVVRMYTCGITPYDSTHLGHAATYVTYDILHRRLVDRGHEVRLVRNITDVDDDLLERSKRDGINYLDLAFGQKRRFDEDLERLGNLEPWSEPRATSAIPDIRGMISAYLSEGFAYESEGAVYFDHTSVPSFGSVSGYDDATMLEVGASRGEQPGDEAKKHPLDTVLWKPSEEGEPAWESPWGRGRPGWHVECSALALRELGPVIDIHGGGCDLVYPHHEFCAAQNQASTGKPETGIWIHQSCVNLNGEPMSKSTANLIFVDDLLENHDPRSLRLAVLSVHYRTTEWEWSDALLDAATARLASWVATPRGSANERLLNQVRDALDDDLDAPSALASIDAAAHAGESVIDAAALLGITL